MTDPMLVRQAGLLYREKMYEEAAIVYAHCIKQMMDDTDNTEQDLPTEGLTYLDQIKYMHCICLLELDNFENIREALNQLSELKHTYGDMFPAIYCALARGYMKIYKFQYMKTMIDKGVSCLSRHTPIDDYCVPETNIIIEHTTRMGLLVTLSTLEREWENCKQPDAFCALDSNCRNIKSLPYISSSLLEKDNIAIYFRDPTFRGMATIYCSNDLPCVLQYHWDCWEYLKNGNNITIREDEDMLDTACKNCKNEDVVNKIIQIEIINADGKLVSTFISRNKSTSKREKNSEKGAIKKDLITCKTESDINEEKRKKRNKKYAEYLNKGGDVTSVDIEPDTESEKNQKRELSNYKNNIFMQQLHEQQSGVSAAAFVEKNVCEIATATPTVVIEEGGEASYVESAKDNLYTEIEIKKAISIPYPDEGINEEENNNCNVNPTQVTEELCGASYVVPVDDSSCTEEEAIALLTNEDGNDSFSPVQRSSGNIKDESPKQIDTAKKLFNESDESSSSYAARRSKRSQSTDKEVPKYFSGLDTSPKKSVSSSEKSSKPGSRSLRTSPFKRSMDEALRMVDKMKKRAGKWSPSFLKRSSSSSKIEESEAESSQHLAKNKGKKAEDISVTDAEDNSKAKRQILFTDSGETVKYTISRTHVDHKSPDHTADKLGATVDDKIISIASTKKSRLSSMCKTLLTNKKTSEENIETEYLQATSCSQCAILSNDYFEMCKTVVDVDTELEKKICAISEHEITIENLHKTIDELTSKVAILKKNLNSIRSPSLDGKILGRSLQQYRILISETLEEQNKQLRQSYKNVMIKEKNKITKEKDEIILKHEERNIELQKDLEMNQKELAYVKKQLKSMLNMYYDFKKKMLQRRLKDRYENTKFTILRVKDFYEVAYNVLQTMKDLYERITEEVLSVEELVEWRDNIFFFHNELKKCEELYRSLIVDLENDQYVNISDDIEWLSYKIPDFDNASLASYVSNIFASFYNTLTEKWAQNVSPMRSSMSSQSYTTPPEISFASQKSQYTNSKYMTGSSEGISQAYDIIDTEDIAICDIIDLETIANSTRKNASNTSDLETIDEDVIVGDAIYEEPYTDNESGNSEIVPYIVEIDPLSADANNYERQKVEKTEKTEHDQQQNITTTSTQHDIIILDDDKENKNNTSTEYEKQINEEVTTNEVNLVSDKESLDQADKDLNKEMIIGKASNERVITTKLTNKSDNMNNLPPKKNKNYFHCEKQSNEGSMMREANLASDKITLGTVDEDSNEIVIISESSEDKNQTSISKKTGRSTVTDCEKQTDEGATTSEMNQAGDEKINKNKLNDDSTERINNVSRGNIPEIINILIAMVMSELNARHGNNEITRSMLNNDNDEKNNCSPKSNPIIDQKTQTEKKMTVSEMNRAGNEELTLDITSGVNDEKVIRNESSNNSAERIKTLSSEENIIDTIESESEAYSDTEEITRSVLNNDDDKMENRSPKSNTIIDCITQSDEKVTISEVNLAGNEKLTLDNATEVNYEKIIRNESSNNSAEKIKKLLSEENIIDTIESEIEAHSDTEEITKSVLNNDNEMKNRSPKSNPIIDRKTKIDEKVTISDMNRADDEKLTLDNASGVNDEEVIRNEPSNDSAEKTKKLSDEENILSKYLSEFGCKSEADVYRQIYEIIDRMEKINKLFDDKDHFLKANPIIERETQIDEEMTISEVNLAGNEKLTSDNSSGVNDEKVIRNESSNNSVERIKELSSKKNIINTTVSEIKTHFDTEEITRSELNNDNEKKKNRSPKSNPIIDQKTQIDEKVTISDMNRADDEKLTLDNASGVSDEKIRNESSDDSTERIKNILSEENITDMDLSELDIYYENVEVMEKINELISDNDQEENHSPKSNTIFDNKTQVDENVSNEDNRASDEELTLDKILSTLNSYTDNKENLSTESKTITNYKTQIDEEAMSSKVDETSGKELTLNATNVGSEKKPNESVRSRVNGNSITLSNDLCENNDDENMLHLSKKYIDMECLSISESNSNSENEETLLSRKNAITDCKMSICENNVRKLIDNSADEIPFIKLITLDSDYISTDVMCRLDLKPKGKFNGNLSNDTMHIDGEMNAINDMLSITSKQFPNVASMDVLIAIKELKYEGKVLSNSPKSTILAELLLVLSKRYDYRTFFTYPQKKIQHIEELYSDESSTEKDNSRNISLEEVNPEEYSEKNISLEAANSEEID